MAGITVTIMANSGQYERAVKQAGILAEKQAADIAKAAVEAARIKTEADKAASAAFIANMHAEIAAIEERMAAAQALAKKEAVGLRGALYEGSQTQGTSGKMRIAGGGGLWAEQAAWDAKLAAAKQKIQSEKDNLITGSQVTRVTGMTDRLARLRSELLLGGEAAAAARKEIRMLASAQGIGALASAAGGIGTHKPSVTGAIREATVIFREIAAGRGAGRILSSATLLGQYLWGGFLKALLSIPGLVTIAAASIFYFVHDHLKKLNDAMDKTAESMSKALGDRARANFDAMLEGARAAGELKERISELGKVHETLSDQLDESLRKMHEEFQLMRDISKLHGETPMQERAAEQALRKKELDLINQTLEKQKQLAAAAKKADEDATAAAFSGGGAKDRNARLKDMPGVLEDAKKEAARLAPIMAELQEMVEKETRANLGEDYNYRTGQFDIRGTPAQIAHTMAYNSGKQFLTKSGEYLSLNNVAPQLASNQALARNLPGQMAALEELQRQLASAASKAASGNTQAAADVITLTKKRDALADEIGLHGKYDSRLNQFGRGGGGGRADVTERERIGLGAGSSVQVSILDFTKQIARNTHDSKAVLDYIHQHMKENEGGFD